MPELIHRIEDCEVRSAGERTLTFTASTEQVARDEEIVLVKGWDTEQFERNPVFLWSHNPWDPPIGRVVSIKKVRGKKARLEVNVEFAGLEQLHDLAEQVHLLYRDGFLKAVSVGFRVKERRDPTETEAKAGARSVVTKAELMEISAVTVPADTDALIQNSDTPDEVREAAVAVRSAMAEPTEGTSSETITIEMVRDVIHDEIQTIAADVSATVITDVRALMESHGQTSPVNRHPADVPSDDSEEDDLYGFTDDTFKRAAEPEEDDL